MVRVGRTRETIARKRNFYGRISRLLIMGAWLCGILLAASCDAKEVTVTITAEEFRFIPNRVEIPAHEIVQLIVRNQGRERHVFQSPILAFKGVRVVRNPLTGPWQGKEGILLLPGQRIELSVELVEGLYSFRCLMQGHRGMEGSLIVVN